MISVGEKRESMLLPGTGTRPELDYPDRIVPPPSWLGHAPFAQWLIGVLKPRVVVELGVHTGNSYCAFLQAVHKLGLDTRCYGIDHWQGDEHSGYYGDEVYDELRTYHDERYGTFSTLLRSSFDAALSYFTDDSVDLLHIDGFHTYEAVSADFASWLPKISTLGVVLLHDTNVRERGFGTWQFWEELASRYPHFEFLHSHGLGVAYVGTEPLAGLLKELFRASDDARREGVRDYFARLGTSVIERFAIKTLNAKVAEARGQVSAVKAELGAAQSELALFGKTNAELAEARAQVSALKAEVAVAQSELALFGKTNAELAEVKTQVSALKAEVAVAQSELAHFSNTKAQVAKLEAELASVRSDASQAKARVAALNNELAEARAKVARREADEEARLSELRTMYVAATLQADIKTSVVRQGMVVTARVQRELLEVNLAKRHYQQQLQEILQSRSWRITGPMRRIVTKLRMFLPSRDPSERSLRILSKS